MSKQDKVTDFYEIVWILSWFASIWSPVYKTELFLTGFFSLVLGLMHLYSKNSEEVT